MLFADTVSTADHFKALNCGFNPVCMTCASTDYVSCVRAVKRDQLKIRAGLLMEKMQ